MTRRVAAACVLLSLFGVACARSERQPPVAVEDVFPQPPTIVSHDGVARLAIAARLDPHTLMPTFSYAGTLGGAPTIRVRPGDRIEVGFANRLPANDPMGNATNLHFHGLVVSPRAPGDETLRTLALPGQTLHYVVTIARDQQPGLYWYHPHAHGNTFRQVGLGGMSGAIVVEGLGRDVPALATMRERLLVVRDVFDSLDTNELRGHPELAPPEIENGSVNTPCKLSAGTHLTVNGAIDPAIPFAAGETQFFRLLNATATRFLDISLARATLRLVALDGVALDAYPGARTNVPFTHIVVAPGARAEFTVSGARPGDRLATACYDAGPDGDPDPAGTLATIASSAAFDRAAAPERIAARHNPLAVPLPRPVRNRTVTFTEINRNGGSSFAINGASFDPAAAPLFSIRSGTVERWTIVNDSREVHAFHIHQVHFVPLSIDGVAVARHWLDTLEIPAGRAAPNDGTTPSKTVVLVDFRDPIVRGTFVFHCHLLDHEDGGMMAKIRVY